MSRKAEKDPTEGLRTSIPLARAMLCADCAAVWRLNGATKCPACGSDQALSLARVLNRQEPETRDPAAIYDDEETAI
jgi:hypothetical protein